MYEVMWSINTLSNLIGYYMIQVINVTEPQMLTQVTRLFFAMGHDSLGMRLSQYRDLPYATVYIIHVFLTFLFREQYQCGRKKQRDCTFDLVYINMHNNLIVLRKMWQKCTCVNKRTAWPSKNVNWPMNVGLGGLWLQPTAMIWTRCVHVYMYSRQFSLPKDGTIGTSWYHLLGVTHLNLAHPPFVSCWKTPAVL